MTALLRCESVTRVFDGLVANKDISVDIQPGEIVGLIGPNGAGKTTLVNVLTGFQSIAAGEVTLSGMPVTAWPAWRRARAGCRFRGV